MRPARNVCVCYGLWNPPTASLPNCISAPRVASWPKTQRISFHSSSCALVSVGVVNLASCACLKSEEEGLVKKKRLQYFEFGLQYLVQPLGVNPTYSTFKLTIITLVSNKLPQHLALSTSLLIIFTFMYICCLCMPLCSCSLLYCVTWCTVYNVY